MSSKNPAPVAEDAGTEDEDKEEQEKEKIADDRPIDQSSSDSNSTSRNDPANMQLIGDVWVFTDPSSGVHYRHDGNGWVPYGTETETTALQKPQIEQEGDMEIVNGRWVHRDASGTRRYYSEEDEEWKLIEPNDSNDPESGTEPSSAVQDELEFQLQQEQLEKRRLAQESGKRRYTDPKDNTEYEWDPAKKAWFPLINEDFLANYQANYGNYTQEELQNSGKNGAKSGEVGSTIMEKKDQKPGTSTNTDKDLEKVELEKRKLAAMTNEERREYIKEQKKEKRRLAAEQERKRGWIEMSEEKNTNVYVSGLPLDITDAEFEELMSKCGIVQKDPRTNKLKMKLYKDGEGNNKGDARCCYVKHESVDLAVQIIDGMDFKGKKLKVEAAHFEQKGDYDPTKKRRKLTARQKKRFMEQQEHLLDWKPERSRFERPKSDHTVVLRNAFTLQELAENAALLFDLEKETESDCAKYGVVKKVTVYDNNPEGVITVTFESATMADDCVTMMNYRQFHGKQLQASLWDGKEKFRVVETEEQKQKRKEAYEKFIENE